MVNKSEILPTHFSIYRNDRCSRGGGVLIAVSNRIPYKLFVVPTPPKIEQITIELILNPPTIICCLYIPPNSPHDYNDEMLHYLRSLPTNIDVVLLGDLNTPDINWLSMVGHSRFSTELCAEFFKSNLTQLISQPTHIHGNLLDIVATNASHRISNIETTLVLAKVYRTTSSSSLI